MKRPQEYVTTMEEFIESRLKGASFEKATREDAAALTMVAFLKDLPVEVKVKNGKVYLMRRSV